MIDDGDCGAIGAMKIGRGNRSTRRKRARVPICPPQIPHDQTQARTGAGAVESQRLTARAMARPIDHHVSSHAILSTQGSNVYFWALSQSLPSRFS
jgi:hypothetical protein